MRARVFAVLLFVLPLLSACGIYSFSGTSIQPDVKTITINYIMNIMKLYRPCIGSVYSVQLERCRKWSFLTEGPGNVSYGW